MCIYVYITLQRECDVSDLEWNVLRIRALHLELPTGVPDHIVVLGMRMDQKVKI